jgi:purine-nucleoside phosphorylase
VYSKIRETVDSIRSCCNRAPSLGLILGSGLGDFADSFVERTVIRCSTLPHFPFSTVSGHHGNLVFGFVEGVSVVALQGRIHLYEGYSTADVVFPARVLCSLGIKRLIVTNAAGGINTAFSPGDLMLITDHINLTGTNPLVGANLDQLGPRFPDMSQAYDAEMRKIAHSIAQQKGILLREGVYIGLLGPSYETPAEIRMCRTLGADAVGMSTVNEVIAARHMGISILGISCVTNMAAGILPGRLTHEEVLATTKSVRATLESLLRGIIRAIGTEEIYGT